MACNAFHSRTAEVSLFLAALELLDEAVSDRKVVVLEAGPVWGYTRAQAESCRHAWRNDTVVVLHPIDPTCNLAAVSGHAILSALHMPTFCRNTAGQQHYCNRYSRRPAPS